MKAKPLDGFAIQFHSLYKVSSTVIGESAVAVAAMLTIPLSNGSAVCVLLVSHASVDDGTCIANCYFRQ